jgi:hypothetical protein
VQKGLNINLIKWIRNTWWDSYRQGKEDRSAEIVAYIEYRMRQRREWASSPDGVESLGPGSPVIPGLEEYDRILRFVRDDDLREWDR